MIVKGIIFEDFVNYKKPSMTIEMPYCDFKCGKENCQNFGLSGLSNINVDITDIITKYLHNPISEAIVFQGLEPFYNYEVLKEWVYNIRQYTQDDIVIYTGFNKEEIINYVNDLKQYHNIIIKFGRYIANQKSHFDNVLGISLASDNQYAERI